MRNVTMIRTEPGLVSVPIERAVFCENCQTVSNSNMRRCGVCGSSQIMELAPLLVPHPWDPGPAPGAALAA